jgi:hypothetical protein
VAGSWKLEAGRWKEGIDVDYEVLGQNNGMLRVAVSGTAVVC